MKTNKKTSSELDKMVYTTVDVNNHQARLMKPLINNLIVCDPSEYDMETPYSNSSKETYNELISMSVEINKMSPSEQYRLSSKHNHDFKNGFIKIVKESGNDFDFDLIQKMVKESSEIILRFKYKDNRPRPWQMADALNIDLFTNHTKTASSPSFPSGHALQSRLIAMVLSVYFPELQEKFIKEADAVGNSRIIGGLHFPSDVAYGKKIGDWMAKHVDLKIKI